MDGMKVLLEIAERFQFENNKIKPPEIYLGGRLGKKNIYNWLMYVYIGGQYLHQCHSSKFIRTIKKDGHENSY